jgi:uncharacterized integral membrane protein
VTGDEPKPAAPVDRPAEKAGRSFQPGLWARLIPIALVAGYVLAFVVLNTRGVKVSFVFGSTHLSLIWVILLALGAGLVLGLLLSQLHRHRQRRR